MAQTLKFGNKVWAAKEDSVLAYNDINNNYKPLPFSFSRASIGTRVNKDGLIETMGQDIARIDYSDSADGVLLLEDSRTNSFLHSNQFDTTWQANYLVLTSGQIGVGGSQNAWLLTGSTGTDEKRLRQSVAPTGNVACSVYAKKGTNDFVWLRGVTAAANKRTFFNLSNGTIGSDASVSSSMIDMGNGWYRCEAVFNQDAGFEFYIGLSDSDGSAVTSTTGNIYIQYSQLEAGSYATSYIPTSGSTVTRASETCDNSGNSEVFNDSEGVLFCDIAVLANDGTNRMISLSDGSSNNRILIKYDDNITNRLEFFVFSGGVGEYSFITTSLITTSNNKIAFKYKQNDFEIWGNGFELDTNTSGNTPIGLSELAFDNGSGSNNFYGKTKELGYYNTILTDAELETLTSYRNWVSMVNELNLNIIYNG